MFFLQKATNPSELRASTLSRDSLPFTNHLSVGNPLTPYSCWTDGFLVTSTLTSLRVRGGREGSVKAVVSDKKSMHGNGGRVGGRLMTRNKSKNTNSDTGRGRAVSALPAARGRAPDVGIDIFEALGRLFVFRLEGLAVAAPRRIELGEHKLVRLPTGMLSVR